MAISTIPGVLDPAVYITGYIPTGVDVGSDFTAIINKANEIIAQSNQNVVDISTQAAVDVNHDALIQANYDDHAAYVASNDAAVGALDTRVTAVEATTSNSMLTVNATTTLTLAQATDNRFINVQDAGSGGTATIDFPLTGNLPSSYPPVTVMNNGFTAVNVTIGGGAAGSWANGAAATDQVVLTNGESVTLLPFDDDGTTDFQWGIIAGKSYSDLTAIP